jgi:serine/threonine protein kinase
MSLWRAQPTPEPINLERSALLLVSRPTGPSIIGKGLAIVRRANLWQHFCGHHGSLAATLPGLRRGAAHNEVCQMQSVQSRCRGESQMTTRSSNSDRPTLPRPIPFAALVSQLIAPRKDSARGSADDASNRSGLGHAKSSPAPPDPYVGVTIDGRYRIESVLGEGGMGVVYLAHHKVIDRRVAIKILRAKLARDKRSTERFLQEAKAASSIGNPHIIDISDFGELPDGSTYFVMEWLDGKPLAMVLEGGSALPVMRVIDIARQTADALAAAHQQGIVHRDLKPENIFLVRHGSKQDFVKILDFGVAKVSTGASHLTHAGSIVGTPLYMAPEQALGESVDSRADIYALGVILYEMASGRVPFDADDVVGVLAQHMCQAPVPIRALVPSQDVPPGLEAIILKALAKKPEQRYQTMEELAQDLDRLARGSIPDAVPEMMARSGGFSVPPEFFKERGVPPLVPASPALVRSRRGNVYARVADVLAAFCLVVLIFAARSNSTAFSRHNRGADPHRAPPHVAIAEPAVAAPPAVAQQPTTAAEPKQVLFACDPLDAHVFQGGLDLGASPLTFDVLAGQDVTVEVRRDGFGSQTIAIDGSEKKLQIKLIRLPGVRPVAAKLPRSAATHPPRASLPAPGGGEIVNPWAK